MSLPPSSWNADFPATDSLLSAIVDSCDDAIVSKDLTGIVMSWNRGAERIFGYTAEEMIGRPILMLFPPGREEEEAEILRRLQSGERVDHFEAVRMTKDGRLIDVSLSISPVRNAEGKIVGASKIARDITHRKQAEKLLVTHKLKLETLNKLGRTIAAELNVHKLVQAVTDAGRELSGAAFGAFFYTVKHPDQEAFMLFALSGAPREAFEKLGMPRNTPIFEPTFNGTASIRIGNVREHPRYGQMAPHHGMPPGHLPVTSYLAVPVVSHAGEVIGGLFYGHPEPDIFTEESEMFVKAIAAHAAIAMDNARLYADLNRELEHQKRMERALRESEQMSSNILKSSGDCIQVLNLDGTLLIINPQATAQFTPINGASLIGRSWKALWPEDMHPVIDTALLKAARGEVARFQGPCEIISGEKKWWDVIVSPMKDQQGQVTRLTATARDVSEQKKAAEQARATAAEAERQSRMKDEFLATLSHELRTPLQSILGWTQLLKTDTCDAEELAQGIDVIDRSARAQARIIEDLLDMSRILAGKVRLDVQRVELSSVIEAAVETVKPTAQAKGVRLQAIIDPIAKPVTGDPNRLQQIFWNLLTNAIKFTPAGGKVHILLERVNSHLEVSVTDTGIGIGPDFLPYVFERFRQADSSSTRQHSGLGLGLAIVKHLAELHGGSVRVKSPGLHQGSTFIVILPLAAIHSEPETDERRHPRGEDKTIAGVPMPNLHKISVLVVDDEPDARTMLSLILTKAGAEVRTASSVQEALRTWANHIPDILISDVGMPDEDGFALIQAIRSRPIEQGGQVPAIALTAYTRTEDRVKAISSGFQMHIAKPADALELLTMVASLAQRRRLN